jgi:hypothetical protein
VHALRNIHASLVPGGTLVDTQPISPRPPVIAGGDRLGTLDMREWRRTIDAVDHRIGAAIADGLFAPYAEESLVVADEFDERAEFADVVAAWEGTRIPATLAARVGSADPPVRVLQEVRLRLLRRLSTD